VLEITARRFRIWRFFDSVWGRENPGGTKPSPDKLLGCAKQLGNAHSLYVGDDPSDMVAATSAGFTGLAVTRMSDRLLTPSMGSLKVSGAKDVVGSLNELPDAIARAW
jgi:phosphoglycolate phosphatase-like HAD superfamily hydrolase